MDLRCSEDHGVGADKSGSTVWLSGIVLLERLEESEGVGDRSRAVSVSIGGGVSIARRVGVQEESEREVDAWSGRKRRLPDANGT